jgi:hypothetical protein
LVTTSLFRTDRIGLDGTNTKMGILLRMLLMYYDADDKSFLVPAFCISVTWMVASASVYSFNSLLLFYLENAKEAGLFVIPTFFFFQLM